MKKLMQMTDFTLEVLNNTPPNNFIKGIESLRNYANFLKQPLTLGMFVPVDEAGNVLKETPPFQFYGEYTSETAKRVWGYKEAQEKVLFEGFSIRKEKGKTYIGTLGYELQLPLNITIEYLANNWTVELTPFALKTIGI